MSKKSTKLERSYGWLPDLPDQRDHVYGAPLPVIGALPPMVDLRAQCPDVYDQGQLGSCTANAIGAAVEFAQMKEKVKAFVPSRLFIYWNERNLEHTVASDAGAQIRDGIKVVVKIGAPPEDLDWPYDIAKFTVRPPDKAFTDARKEVVTSYQRVSQNLRQMQGCLATGFPFVFGFTVYDGFESDQVAKSGIVPMPKPGESALGGHAVMAVGYDDSKQRFIVRNSWGAGWGQKGYFEMPYAYMTDSNLSDDLWTIRIVTE